MEADLDWTSTCVPRRISGLKYEGKVLVADMNEVHRAVVGDEGIGALSGSGILVYWSDILFSVP